ncbi:MAG: type IX secretion system sortase PorU, partial [Polaribacter sp.]
MKEKLLLFFCFLTIYVAHAQVNNSVLASGNWYKFSVDTTGVFKIDKNLLQKIGISTNGLNPKKIHIYGNGGTLLPVLNKDFRYDNLQENAIYIKGEADGSFNNSDFILFYAKGPHNWKIDSVTKSATHRQNIYSEKVYYFITVNDVDGKRIQQKAANTNTATSTITTFDDFT